MRLHDFARELSDLLSPTRTGLNDIGIGLLTPNEVEQALRWMRDRVPPAYLPFLDYGGSQFALHLLPRRPLGASPVVFLDHDSTGAQYVCRSLAELPAALWLWIGAYYGERRVAAFRSALHTLAATVPGGRPVPEALWEREPPSTSRWEPLYPEVDALWCAADVGHPAAGWSTPALPDRLEQAHERLTALLAEQPEDPGLLATRLHVEASMGASLDVHAALAVLNAEAWRETGWGLKLRRGLPLLYQFRRMTAWGAALELLAHQTPRALERTAFAPLKRHPEAYHDDPEGAGLLCVVARTLRARGDAPGALRQLRNAALVSIKQSDGYPIELCLEMADACEQAEPSCAASLLAAEMVQLWDRAP